MMTNVKTLHCDLCKLKKEDVMLGDGAVLSPDGWGQLAAGIRNGGNISTVLKGIPTDKAASDICPTCIRRIGKKLEELRAQTD